MPCSYTWDFYYANGRFRLLAFRQVEEVLDLLGAGHLESWQSCRWLVCVGNEPECFKIHIFLTNF
jgi:hypothetical protein